MGSSERGTSDSGSDERGSGERGIDERGSAVKSCKFTVQGAVYCTGVYAGGSLVNCGVAVRRGRIMINQEQ